MRRHVVLLAFLASLSPATAQPASIYGIQLGAPLNLPACPTKKIGEMWDFDVLAPMPGKSCAMLTWASPTGFKSGDWYEIHYDAADLPLLARHGYISAWASNGTVQDVIFITAGVQAQDAVKNALITKFGPVEFSKIDPVHNGFDASFDVFHGHWRSGDVTVRYDGAIDSLDSGEVEVQTQQGRDMRKQEEAYIEAHRQKM